MAKTRFAPGTLITFDNTTVEVQGINITRQGDIYDMKYPTGEKKQALVMDLKRSKRTATAPVTWPPVEEITPTRS